MSKYQIIKITNKSRIGLIFIKFSFLKWVVLELNFRVEILNPSIETHTIFRNTIADKGDSVRNHENQEMLHEAGFLSDIIHFYSKESFIQA